MKFTFLQDNDAPLWDEFVARSPQGSIFSTSTYLNALGTRFRIGVLLKKDTIKAGIVLTKDEIGAFSNPLFAKYLGVLLPPAEKYASYVNQFTRERKLVSLLIDNLITYRSFDYSFHPNYSNWLPFYWRDFRQETRYTYRLSDIGNIDSLLNNMHSRVRRALRKADQNGIQCRPGISVKSFYRINRLSFERQGGSPPYSIQKLQALYDGLINENRIHLLGAINTENQIVAVAGIINDTKYSYLILNGIDHTKKNVGANTKLIIETLRYCSKLTTKFDFEGSMIEGIESFYQSFGAIQTPYHVISRNNMVVTMKRKLIKTIKQIRYGR